MISIQRNPGRQVLLGQKTLLVLMFMIQCFQLAAQKYDSPFGEFKEAELRQVLEMKYYANDSSANSLILYEKGLVDRTRERTRITHLRRVKIFTNDAVNIWGNMVRDVDERGITHVKGNCYTLVNGIINKRSLSDANIFKTDKRPGIDTYAAAMPNVVPGSVVEFEFETNLTRYYTYFDWVFQTSVPTLLNEYFVSSTYPFNSDVGGIEKAQYSYDKLRGIHHWWLANSPAFHAEVMMPHVGLYRSSLNTFYESIPWDRQVLKIWKAGGIGLLINGKPSWERKAEEITAGITDQKEKVKAIVNYVKETMVWDGTDGIEAFEIDKSLEKKMGSAPDLNIYMISLLRKAGIEVNPVFIQPREYGSYHEHFPTLEQFNYVIGQVAIGSDTIYVDATDRLLPYDALPYRCLNYRGLVLLKKDAKWINIKPRMKNRVIFESTLNLDVDGTLSGKVLKKAEGYAAHTWRRSFSRGPKDLIEMLASNTWTIAEGSQVNVDKVDQSVVINYDITTTSNVTVGNDFMYVTPFAFADTTNLFKSDKRMYPIDLVVLQEQVLIFNFSIPDGYMVDRLPESKVISLLGNTAKAIFNFSNTAKQVQVLMRVMINSTYFGADDYPALRDFYQRLTARQKELIVLKMK